MGVLDFFRLTGWAGAKSRPNIRAEDSSGTSGVTVIDFQSPEFLEFVRYGETGGGYRHALRNVACLRAVSLISNSIGRLPLNLIHDTPEKELASDHPAYRLVKRKPNEWQTPYEFKSLLQTHALLDGNGYARVIRSGSRPVRLIPMELGTCEPRLSSDWRMEYEWTAPDGARHILKSSEVFHLRGLSTDGIKGLAPVRLANEAIQLALSAQRAAARVFETGNMAGGALEFDKELSQSAYDRLRQSLEERHGGAENAGKWMLVEEGGKAVKFASTSADAQQIENRNHQIEEVARLYGVPRPLLMMDDTSWGSGIEQLAIFLVQYTLAPWMTAWEQALARVLLSEKETEALQFKFNERALLRGSLKDQAEFMAKALGAGGQSPWMTQNEVREVTDLPRSSDKQADLLRNPMTQKAKTDEPAQTS